MRRVVVLWFFILGVTAHAGVSKDISLRPNEILFQTKIPGVSSATSELSKFVLRVSVGGADRLRGFQNGQRSPFVQEAWGRFNRGIFLDMGFVF